MAEYKTYWGNDGVIWTPTPCQRTYTVILAPPSSFANQIHKSSFACHFQRITFSPMYLSSSTLSILQLNVVQVIQHKRRKRLFLCKIHQKYRRQKSGTASRNRRKKQNTMSFVTHRHSGTTIKKYGFSLSCLGQSLKYRLK